MSNLTEDKKIRVLLADDHRLLAEGFRNVLTAFGIDVVAVVHELGCLEEEVVQYQPDVIVLDVRFTNESNNGLDACKKLMAKNPGMNIVVFSQFDDPYIIEMAYESGAKAFVRKDERPEVMFDAISSAFAGEKYFSPVAAQLIAKVEMIERNPRKILSEKELSVFAMLADGATHAEVAEKLDLSTKTIGSLYKEIKRKLSIENPVEFTKLAIRFGIVKTK